MRIVLMCHCLAFQSAPSVTPLAHANLIQDMSKRGPNLFLGYVSLEISHYNYYSMNKMHLHFEDLSKYNK